MHSNVTIKNVSCKL